jgi:uncharacterized membrane protein
MEDAPVEVVIAAFTDEQGADDAFRRLREAQDNGLIQIRDAAIIRRDQEGTLNTEDTGRHGMGRGAVVGGVTGAIVGLLAGPVGWAAGAGVLIGALASRLRESGFPEERLQQVGGALKPGTSALVAVIEHTWVQEVANLLADSAADIDIEAIQADIAQQLEAGRDVAYTALTLAGTTEVARVTADTAR